MVMDGSETGSERRKSPLLELTTGKRTSAPPIAPRGPPSPGRWKPVKAREQSVDEIYIYTVQSQACGRALTTRQRPGPLGAGLLAQRALSPYPDSDPAMYERKFFLVLPMPVPVLHATAGGLELSIKIAYPPPSPSRPFPRLSTPARTDCGSLSAREPFWELD